MRPIIAGIFLASWLATGLPAYAQNPETTVAFEMPLNAENWKPDIVGQNGIYRFRQVHGACQITFAQNLGADAARAAGRTPHDALDIYVQRLDARFGEIARGKGPDLKLRARTGDPVVFPTIEVSYRGKDGVDYRNRIAAQWVDVVELVIIAACPSSEWETQGAAIDGFITKVSVHR